MAKKYKRRIYCQFCDFFCYDADEMVAHIEKHHPEVIPEDFSPWRFFYFLKTGNKTGGCVICKKPTDWNEKTHKYNRFCNNPLCKEKYKKTFDKRMIGMYGKTSLFDDPDYHRKLLANRRISGIYTWRDHITQTTYTGSYEKSFLEFLDNVLELDPKDVIGPSPHTYYYQYEGKQHFYIPDFFIPSLNLEVEIKDGGDNPNTHPKIMAVDKVKEELKDNVMKSNSNTFNYIKITNKDNQKLFRFLEEIKFNTANKIDKNIIML
jgi:hypothetical protein